MSEQGVEVGVESSVGERGEYEEYLKILEPFLYATTDIVATVKQKYSEFYFKKNQGIQYTRDELFKLAFQNIRSLVEYLTEDAGRSGLVKKLVMKHAEKYIFEHATDLLFGSKK